MIHDVDKSGVDRSSPRPNSHDSLGDLRPAHNTLSSQYKPPSGDPDSGHLQFDNKRLIANDGITTRALLGYNSAMNLWGFFLTKLGIDVNTNTDTSQFIFNSNQNVFKIADIILGSHTITSGEASALWAAFSFPHGLSFKPTVIGSFTVSTDNLTRQLPFTRRTQSYYGGVAGDASVDIQSVDATNINCAFSIYNSAGLSWLLSNTVLSFKFYCLQESVL